MNLISKLTTAAAVATIAAGAGATAASAYSISGGAYAGAYTAVPTLAIADAYLLECGSVAVTGAATGSDVMSFAPSHDGCTFFGFPFAVTQSGAWNVEVTGGSGPYSGTLEIPAGSTMTWSASIMGCTFVVAGPQSFSNAVSLDNVTGGVELSMSVGGIAYTATGCPFSSGTDGVLETNGVVSLPGITIS